MSEDYRDQHKVCIVRDEPKGPFYPHLLRIFGETWVALNDEQADGLHAVGIPWSTDEPLPEGVFRAPDGRLLATCEVARQLVESDDWTAHNTSGVGGPLNAATIAWTSTIVEVRPCEPPAPKTDEQDAHDRAERIKAALRDNGLDPDASDVRTATAVALTVAAEIERERNGTVEVLVDGAA